ncbi:hypothetical protein BU14_0032s0019 [Porphyra umbilicalis]|uniref:Uncharacterized protein n=1 Tax=Porphyra umbilicalis TaxID=2786 RepID=A0A1X6PIS0_PORUM|nr:hypothetical protein BU14_0032s0019 [Porphyra umbilicalis]|eukprot:OSX80761.1 hypothetical protein BU14_0032s0019 [Porphyra umbilicalis]
MPPPARLHLGVHRRHALSPYPTSFLSPSPIPSLPDVPPRRSPASFVRQYRVGHLSVGIHAAPLIFFRHHPCPCRRRAIGLLSYGNNRGHRAPGFLFALLEHRTAVLVCTRCLSACRTTRRSLGASVAGLDNCPIRDRWGGTGMCWQRGAYRRQESNH